MGARLSRRFSSNPMRLRGHVADTPGVASAGVTYPGV